YEEIVIPPNQKIPMRSNERLIQISELDPICKRSFSGYKTLNRLQSAVFSTAYRTNENMLVCAPTGAGKTDVAMLAVLRAISQYGGLNLEKPVKGLRNNFKVIYVAPMKALASEVVRKMEKRLGWLGMVVKELTGDMQLTREEIDKTHFIVTTPEKWDVVTRKSSGEEDLVSRVKLLIIDEVHLLHEERGAVIETIVARTLRQVESSQSLIRIVGLSATLPNYLDVAEFLRVNQLQGLFYFDSSFRPVPLEQHFIGVKGKPNSMKSRTNLDIATFEKVSELVKEGHQVMVFVHARKETVKTAEMLRERAKEEGLSELFDPSENPRYDSFTRDLSGSKNKQMKDLAKDGFGIHHAGMLRSDRNISERLFEAGVTRLLCCTATLAWGVNLPAYAVIIKGTQIYDSSKGSFVDLGILDVLQIFGRAGRPQYEDHGVGYICTTHDSLDHYVAAITQQHPIESQFVAGMVDSLNAEIALGTVRSVDEGVRWIGWTYLFVRMRKNPLVYGITISDVEDDPFLGSRRHTLIEVAAKKLQKIGMVIFDETTGSLQSTELGKIASKFYIKNASIEIFNGIFRSKMSEADILAMISESVEFDQIKVRESEAEELEQLEKEAPCQVKGGPTSTPGKVNILLQAYISRLHVEDFALISDTAYVAQNAARIARALVDIGVWKKLADTARVMIEMAKCIDKQIWPFMHPLIQSNLSDKLVYDLDQRAGDIEIEELVEMKASEIGKLCRLNDRLGSVILRAAKQFPRLAISYTLQPLSSDLLRVRIHLEHKFEWSSQIHGQGEAFWIWLEDGNQRDIFRITKIYLRSSAPKIDVDLILSLDSQPLLDYFAIRVISDQWLGAENLKEVSLDGLVLCPTSPPPPPTPLLDLPLLSTTRLEQLKDKLHIIGLPDHLHPVETQCFHTVYHTPHDCLICAPERSVSRNLTLLAIGRALRLEISEEKNIFVVVPRVEMVKMYTKFLGDAFKMFPVKVNSAFDNSRSVSQRLSESQITIITPKFGLALPEKVERIKKVLTILIDVHDLSEEYELFIERIINEWHESRLIAFSSSLLDPRSLASWLGIEPRRIYNFRLNSRSTPISVDFQAIKTPYSSTQWKSMVLPVWTAIQGSEKRSVMIFVQSRGVCEGLAKSLIQYSASTITQNGSGAVDESLSEYYIRQFKDERVADLLRHRMMILEDNRMTKQEVELTIDLFRRRAIKVLIMTRESCWRISDERLRSEIVILMGTQY
ncbi:Sec63 Brl domain-containing protein, partial [Phakopsora pachyrhizi]